MVPHKITTRRPLASKIFSAAFTISSKKVEKVPELDAAVEVDVSWVSDDTTV